ncbi:conserved hypothetical protein [Vibrio phage 424E50-1]|nr:conserved hypothetical protein [Vibrio phage 424E50-1]CAH9013181.1 conserved hypothetical protein [Vibrio phage 501E54-1]
MKIKIYTNDEKILDQVCKAYGLESDYLRTGYGNHVFGYGYCSEGRYLRVFCQNSGVDNSNEYEDLTEAFTNKPKFTL